MSKAARNSLLIVAVMIISAFGLKLLWDEYQMKRAMEKNPKVVALLDQIHPFPSSSRIESDYDGPSANEYSSVVWRYYLADATKCSDVHAHLNAEVLRNGFEFDSIGHQNSGIQVYYKKGEYEMRSLFEPQNSASCNYAVSVNWSPSDWVD